MEIKISYPPPSPSNICLRYTISYLISLMSLCLLTLYVGTGPRNQGSICKQEFHTPTCSNYYMLSIIMSLLQCFIDYVRRSWAQTASHSLLFVCFRFIDCISELFCLNTACSIPPPGPHQMLSMLFLAFTLVQVQSTPGFRPLPLPSKGN
jgi:hypothetical protein